MILHTTNKNDFKDFEVVLPGQKRRSQSAENLPDTKAEVTYERNLMNPNDSKEFMSTLGFSSPFFNTSSYQKTYLNYGGCKNSNIS